MENDLNLSARGVCKAFAATRALIDVDVDIRMGEIRGLIGENGSGKSTFSSIIAGALEKDEGEITLRGEKYEPTSMVDAQDHGVAMIVQEAGTLPGIDVASNIFAGRLERFSRLGFLNWKKIYEEADAILDEIGVPEIRGRMNIEQLNFEDRKIVEIARAMASHPEILIIDETTTALATKGRKIIYDLIQRMHKENKAILFISHDLDELMEVCNTITVLRDGVIIDNLEKKDYDPNDIKHKMVGREVKGNYYRSDMDGYEDEVVLRADCITTMRELLCFDLELHKGEILGVGGLSECGMHALGRALYGLDEVVDGQVVLTKDGTVIKNAETAFKHGMGYVSKNRDQESLELNASIGANIQSVGYKKNRLFGPIISGKKERRYAELMVDQLAIKCVNIWQPVRSMSGGNKQKVVFGKWIADDADVLILDCPTRGVDIGVKAAMYQLIYDMKKKGKSIVMISEEMPELIGMADRLLIMKDGKGNGEFYRKDGYDEHALIECMI